MQAQIALQLTDLFSRLLLVIPTDVVFRDFEKPTTSEDTSESPSVALTSEGTDQLEWQASSLPPKLLALQLELIAKQEVLAPLVRLVLPAADSFSAGAGSPVVSAGSVFALCRLLHILLDERGLQQRVLITLAVSTNLVQRLWFSYIRGAHLVGLEGWTPTSDNTADPGWMLPLTVLCSVYITFVSTASENEMYVKERPLPLAELYSIQGGRQVGLISLLKFALWQVLWVETPPSPGGWSAPAGALRSELKKVLGKLLSDLYVRNCRRSFAPAEAFHVSSLPPERFHAEVAAASVAEGGLMEATHTRVWALLETAPFLIPFQERVRVFMRVVSVDRQQHRDQEMVNLLAFGSNKFISIRRTAILEDGFREFNQTGENLRGRIRIQFINEYGDAEAGVDGGGLFKDFMESIVREGFNPAQDLFKATAENRLYPNPAVGLMVHHGLEKLNFLGKIVGKALYEGILVELPLAGFLLKKLLGKAMDVNDLPSLDKDLYRSLMFLRDYEGNVEDLSLTFTINRNDLEQNAEVPLVRGGNDIPVTNANRVDYIYRVANYRLNNEQMQGACKAFRNGLLMVVRDQWLKMFNGEELQMLISGGGTGRIDLDDLRKHVQYAGGYHEEHPVILHLWQALESLTGEQQGQFLKFVTSCSRPPLLGFKYLEPPLCIQMVGGVLDVSAQQRLPTASTCINMLKLPPYSSADLIREKLLYAIRNISGFDLS
eukprot:jgi/Botrbrau1/16412/Bobra.0142s0012.1